MRLAMKRSRVTLEDAAAFLHVETADVQRLLAGPDEPTPEIVQAWALLTGASHDWLSASVTPTPRPYRRGSRKP